MSPIPFVVLALCGLAFGAVRPVPRFGGRIVDGEPTTIEEHPYQLSIRMDGHFFCGASIIGPYHALTNGECGSRFEASQISLHSGTSNVDQVGTRHQAISITIHPKYIDGHLDYDYAIIEVHEPFPNHAVELCSVEPSAGETAVVTGWGALNSDFDLPNQLQVANIPVISRSDCEDKFSSFTQRMICAGMGHGGKGTCIGDSGGPLIVNGKQCGVVSGPYTCIIAGLPDVYANVADQLSWIQTTARM